MSIKKQHIKSKGICKVTFTVSASDSTDVQNVHVVGEFNSWSTSATPMKRYRKGIFTAPLELKPGREYQFRYLLNDDQWINDVEADKSADTPYGDASNSVIVLNRALEHQRKQICALVLELSVAEQRERQRLSIVLHDDLQQLLAYLKLRLSALKVGSKLKCISLLLSQIDQGIYRCRNLAKELSLPVLTQEGFCGTVEWLERQMEQMYGMEVTLRDDPIPDIKSLALSTMLIRSIRELLFNIIKHSGKIGAWVDIRCKKDLVLISVRDNGKGCDSLKLLKKQNTENLAKKEPLYILPAEDHDFIRETMGMQFQG